MQTKLVGGGTRQPGVEQGVDPSFQAAKVAFSPLEYAHLGKNLGHYRCTDVTGTTVSIAAGGILSYKRWTDGSNFMVLVRLAAAVAISSAITAATVADLAAFVARGSNAAGSGGNAITLTGSNQKNRATMGASLITDARVATTGALTRPAGATVDANPFGASAFQTLASVTATGTATLGAVGTASPVVDLYKWDALGQHPIVLTTNEHVEVQELTAGPVTGGLKWYITYEWAEVVLY